MKPQNLLYQILYTKYYKLFDKVPTTFLVEESNFLPVSVQSEVNFNAHPKNSVIDDRDTSLNDLCTVSKKRLVEEIFIKKSEIDQ